eukprot:SAG31_NODE_121_length_23854_cov_16.182404_2_plen_1650_part_00
MSKNVKSAATPTVAADSRASECGVGLDSRESELLTTPRRIWCLRELAQACVSFAGCHDREDGVFVRDVFNFARRHAALELDLAGLEYIWHAMLAHPEFRVAPKFQLPMNRKAVKYAKLARSDLRLVPSARLADFSLGICDPNINLGDTTRMILELVGQAGISGVMQTELSDHCKLHANHIFPHVRRLEEMKLIRVVRRSLFPLIFLARHYQEYQDSWRVVKQESHGDVATKLANAVVQLLREALNKTMVASELRARVGLRGKTCQKTWEDLERIVLRRGVTVVKANVGGKLLKCLQLQEVQTSAIDGIVDVPMEGQKLVAEDTLKRQVYDTVAASGAAGTALPNVVAMLGIVADKYVSKIVQKLIESDLVRSFPVTTNGKFSYRLVAAANFQSNHNSVMSLPMMRTAAPATACALQVRRRDLLLHIIREEKIMWMSDILVRMQELSEDASLRKQQLHKIVNLMENSKQVQKVAFSLPAQKLGTTRERIAVLLEGTKIQSAVVAAFLAQARKKTHNDGLDSLPLTGVTVHHSPIVQSPAHEDSQAARHIRIGYGFIEMKVARFRGFHQYLWQRSTGDSGAGPNESFCVKSLLEQMPIKTFAQVVGISEELPDIDKLFEKDVPMERIPAPHGIRILGGTMAYKSAKELLMIGLKLGLLVAEEDQLRSAKIDSGKVITVERFSLVSHVKLPAFTSGQEELSQSVACRFKDKVYDFIAGTSSSDGNTTVGEYWNDLRCVAFGVVDAHSCPRGRVSVYNDQGSNTALTKVQIAELHGRPELAELFLKKNWIRVRPLTNSQLQGVEAAIKRAGLAPPYTVKDLATVVDQLRGVLLHNVLPHFLAVQHPSWPLGPPLSASELRPIETPPATSHFLHKQSLESRLAWSQLSPLEDAHQPGSQTCRQENQTAQGRRMKFQASSDGWSHVGQVAHAAPKERQATKRYCEATTYERSMPQKRQRYPPYTREMECRLLIAYAVERDRVSASREITRLSWENVAQILQGTDGNMSKSINGGHGPSQSAGDGGSSWKKYVKHLQRRYTVLSKQPVYREALAKSANSAILATTLNERLQTGLQTQMQLVAGHPVPASEPPLPTSITELHRLFRLRTDINKPVEEKEEDQTVSDAKDGCCMKPALAALGQALKAKLLVPEEELQQAMVISLLSRFNNDEIEEALLFMQRQRFIVPVKNSAGHWRLSAKFHANSRLTGYPDRLFADIAGLLDAESVIGPALVASEPAIPVGGAAAGLQAARRQAEATGQGGGPRVALALAQLAAGHIDMRPCGLLSQEEQEQEMLSSSMADAHVSAKDAQPDQQLRSEAAVSYTTERAKGPRAPQQLSLLEKLLDAGALQRKKKNEASCSQEVELPDWLIEVVAKDACCSWSPCYSWSKRRACETTAPASPAAQGETAAVSCVPASGVLPSVQSVQTGSAETWTPEEALQSAAVEAGVTIEDVRTVWNAIVAAGKDGAPANKLPGGPSAAAALAALVSQRWVVRVAAWDHHRWVATNADHNWATGVSIMLQSHQKDGNYSGSLPPGRPFAEVLHSWHRLDGVKSQLRTKLRHAVVAFVMKHPGIELAAICARFESMAPRETEDMLSEMVVEGLLWRREVPTELTVRSANPLAQPMSVDHNDCHMPRQHEVTVDCYWAAPQVCLGTL